MEPVSTASWLVPTLVSSATDILGGFLGRKGQKDANRMNLQIAREQMRFQERMSSTANQRAAADLEAAGLNRILALGKPASSPAGQSAVMQNPNAPLQTGLSAASLKMHNALELKRKAAEIRVLGERARLTGNQADALKPAAEVGDTVGDWIDSMQNTNWEAIKDRVKQDIGRLLRTSPKTAAAGARLRDANVEAAKETIARVLAGTNVDPDKAALELIAFAKTMDIPPNMTDEEILVWAVQNIDKVKRANARRKATQ